MSSDVPRSQIASVVGLAKRLYRQCKNAGGEYLEISREVRGLHTVLKHLRYEAEAEESILNHTQSAFASQLYPIVEDSDHTLRLLDELLRKYGRLSEEHGGRERQWDKTRLSSAEMDELGSIRMKLINHMTAITVLLDVIQLQESGKVATTLELHSEQLDTILDKVDGIAARMEKRAGSVLTTYDDDDKEVWKQFRRELVAEGFSSDVLQQHKDVLRAYIREIDQNGLLEEVPPQQPSVDTEKWLENVSVMSPESEFPPSFDSIEPPHDMSAKMLVFEDNIKFPQSLKEELNRPKTNTKQNLALDVPPGIVKGQNSSMRSISPTTSAHLSPGTSDAPCSSTAARNKSASRRAQDEARAVTLPNRNKGIGGENIPSAMPRTPVIPDLHEEPRWTTVRRSLVSQEALDEAGIRYEMHPQHIVIYSVLSRDEIEDLVERTMELKSSRRPNQPPRPHAHSSSDEEDHDRPVYQQRNSFPQSVPRKLGKGQHGTWPKPAPEKKPKSRSRWREGLAVAGISAAGASLLTVLSEAAEAL